ncbi:MAG TPA: hypothetical protein VFC47_07250 [Caulobacteraceae bacterium]|nr:hypothetical protein [Caulobacteraceae bacterium]
MSPPTGAPASFELGRVIDRTFRVLAGNFGVFVVLSLILAGIPAAVAGYARWRVGVLDGGGQLISLVMSMIASVLLQAALIHGVISDLNGRRASLGDCLRTALTHVLPLIGIGLMGGIATFLGLIFFILPGVVIALALSVAGPVRVVERLGVFDSMGRSASLTRDHRGVILVLAVLNTILVGVGSAIGAGVAGIAGLGGPASPLALVLVTPFLQATTSLIGAAGVASVYFELRTIKEGVGVEALAAIFD